AADFNFPNLRIDGNAALTCLDMTDAPLKNYRYGNDHTLVDAYIISIGSQTSNSYYNRYCIDAELDEWKAKDPILRVRRYLEKNGLADEDFFASIDTEADTLAERVRTECRALPDPEPLEIFHEVYAEPNVHIEQQRSEFAEYLASFEDVGAEGGR